MIREPAYCEVCLRLLLCMYEFYKWWNVNVMLRSAYLHEHPHVRPWTSIQGGLQENSLRCYLVVYHEVIEVVIGVGHGVIWKWSLGGLWLMYTCLPVCPVAPKWLQESTFNRERPASPTLEYIMTWLDHTIKEYERRNTNHWWGWLERLQTHMKSFIFNNT